MSKMFEKWLEECKVMNYYKHRLEEKINIILESKGFDPISINDAILIGVRDCRYEVIWHRDYERVVGLSRLSDFSTITIDSGKYIIDSGPFKRILYSSQYIEFNIAEERELKLNKLFDPDEI